MAGECLSSVIPCIPCFSFLLQSSSQVLHSSHVARECFNSVVKGYPLFFFPFAMPFCHGKGVHTSADESNFRRIGGSQQQEHEWRFGMALTYQPVAVVHMWGFHQHRHARMLCMKIASILYRPFTLLIGNSTSPGLEGPGFPPGFNLPQTLLFVVYHGRSSPLYVAQVADTMMRQRGVCHGVMHLGSTGLGSLGTTFLKHASNWRAVWFGSVSEPPCKTWSRTSQASLDQFYAYSCCSGISMCILSWIFMF